MFSFILKITGLAFSVQKRNTDSLVLDHSNMKLVAVFVFLAYCLAVGVDSASVSLSSNSMTLNGNAHIQFYGPREEIWNGLSDGKILNDSYTFFTHSVVGETAARFILDPLIYYKVSEGRTFEATRQ